jgi:hypothetical protein
MLNESISQKLKKEIKRGKKKKRGMVWKNRIMLNMLIAVAVGEKFVRLDTSRGQ